LGAGRVGRRRRAARDRGDAEREEFLVEIKEYVVALDPGIVERELADPRVLAQEFEQH
jgi:hypothetical protein